VLPARLGAALSAWFDLSLDRLHSTLQITRLFEAPMTSLFHHDSQAETCYYEPRAYSHLELKVVAALSTGALAKYHGPMPQELDVDAMLNRFRERARAVRQRGLPPLEGPERKRFADQARTDYMDFAMIGDATATLDNGILTLRLDLRPDSARS
jgi:hypothetical protein